MKNETARREIESLDYYLQNHTDDYSEESHTAMMMAVKALDQEPCEDAISRQAVNILVDELARAISDERCCISRGRSTATIMQDILDLPPVNPQKNIVNNGTMNITL